MSLQFLKKYLDIALALLHANPLFDLPVLYRWECLLGFLENIKSPPVDTYSQLQVKVVHCLRITD
jgi:hypothetical protein